MKDNFNDLSFLLSGLGKLWENGVEIDWDAFYDNEQRNIVSIPTYSFERVKYPVNVDAYKIISDRIDGKEFKINFSDELDTIELADEQHPKSSEEQKLLQLWIRFFGQGSIGVDDDFFEIGGDSLKVLTMIGRIHQEMGVELSLNEFFENPTVSKLVKRLEEKKNESITSGYHDIPTAPKKDSYVLSSAQKRLYFLYKFDETSLAYNLPQAFDIVGEVCYDKLERVVNQLVERHENLRTYFALDNGKPVQKIIEKLNVNVEKYNGDIEDVTRIMQDFVRPFDLNNAPLFRVAIIKTNANKSILLMDFHHIISDGTSFGILMQEFISLYMNRELSEAKLQYKDYSEWQQSPVYQKRLLTHREFWINQFQVPVHPINLPTDFKRPVIKGYEGDVVAFELNEDIRRALNVVAVQSGATMYMVILAIYNVFLAKLSSQDDVVIGTPTSGRYHNDTEKIMGMFVNTIPLRNTFSKGMSFMDFLNKVKTNTLEAFENQSYPYEELIDQLNVDRDTSHNPLFDVMFSYQRSEPNEEPISDLIITPHTTDSVLSQFDLTLFALDKLNSIQLRFEFSSLLFKKKTIESFVGYFNKIIDAVLSKPEVMLSNIEIISDRQKNIILQDFNSNDVDFGENQNIVNAFQSTVITNEDKVALRYNEKVFTYKVLNSRANQLAHKIKKKNIGNSGLVGIMMPRTELLFISILGVLKAGYAYVPIDPTYPTERINHIIKDSGLELILTDAALQGDIQAKLKQVQILNVETEPQMELNINLDLKISSTHLAYMIYTSGSTGKPKGVMIEHGNVINFIEGITKRIPLVNSCFLCLTTVSFDIFVLESLLPLIKGHEVVLADESLQKDPELLSELIIEKSVNTIQITPSHLKMLMSSKYSERMLEIITTLMVGGEAFPKDLLQTLQSTFKGEIFNMYGPTETTVWSSVQELTNKNTIDIGKPIANTKMLVLDSDGNIQPIGIAGELYIGGKGVGRGYWGNTTLTSEKFVSDIGGMDGKFYRTGDSVKWLNNGALEYLGRLDNQVKIRGYRIEMGEIESVILSNEEVQKVVVHDCVINQDKVLVAYYVAPTNLDVTMFRAYLSQYLPDYMIPSYFILINEIPLTPNGKVDRRSLPQPEFKKDMKYVGPNNYIEKQMVRIWAQVLKLNDDLISVDRSFFELGGNSLKATELVSEIQKEFDFELPLRDLFTKQDIQSISDYIITAKQIDIDSDSSEEIMELSI
ncbi:non-ribosomal peptide synthetase [Fulvivirga maritima]|uniref:non-ribosomal peptide synthetase n=1 Tax=Fulvivirga maritima TaxID=2904247 RepID=UPI00272ED97F|nr:amino acid adenylation domain-containing protein [Fulvivirga maritima]